MDPIVELLGEWAGSLNVWSILFRLLSASFMAAVIGCERSGKRHSAGLRTFILVTLATTLSVILDLLLANRMYLIAASSVLGLAIISVHSLFISSRSQIKGLTTSVGLWCCGIVGLMTGAGQYTVALVSFVILYACLTWFPSLERYLKNRSNHFEVHLELKDSRYLQDFVSTIRRLGLTIDDIELNNAYAGSGLSVYSISISISSAELKKYKTHTEIIEALRSLDYIYHIEEMMS